MLCGLVELILCKETVRLLYNLGSHRLWGTPFPLHDFQSGQLEHPCRNIHIGVQKDSSPCIQGNIDSTDH